MALTTLSATLENFLGKLCVGSVAGTGSLVTLEFEPRVLRQRPVPNPSLTEEQRTSEAQYAIFVECAWRLDNAQEVVCGGWDENHIGGPMLRGLQGLTGQRVKTFHLNQPGLDLCLEFDSGLIFRAFCDQVNEHDNADNYSVFCPEEVLIVGTKSRLRREDPSRS